MKDKEKCCICNKDITKELPKIDVEGNHYCKDCYSDKCEIEEMKRIISDVWIVDLEGDILGVSEVLDKVDINAIAIELFAEGYRKLPKDSVVLSKEKYSQLLKSNIEDVSEYIADELANERKETAEKIYLQAKAIVDATKHIVQGREYLHIDALKEIVKSCGVEIKEN